ncbi:NupC/NupG family nucleoside CNT transporter [Aerococcus sp. 1KP-2016]|jgi:nucleoside transport protein|uniref:NupC/NupG family nucleoside CNT transporter n=1 Tax=Aerococcus sp. 1KP-2016 TaxID=1981982 RepID=UPI000B990E7C|nr:nucleoside transporter C-terminal domain-containing protein [Aerococcus sp. 1KP-2016]OYQ67914.1 NupC/NupG family nucleoside CNT transporter [Aerococcus sp. 1KP-2016]
MSIIRGIIGLAIIGLITWLMSKDRKNARFKQVGILLVIMFVFAFIGLQTSFGIAVLEGISAFFNWLILQANGGTQFVFGPQSTELGIFFFNVLMPIVFISGLIGILQYTKVLPIVAKWLGKGLNLITGMGGNESYAATMMAMLGQSNGFISIKKYMDKFSPDQIFSFSLLGLSCVSATTIASYMQMVDGKFVVVAILLNVFAAFIVVSLMAPYDPNAVQVDFNPTEDLNSNEEKENFFAVLSDYISSGFQIALAIAGSLIGFNALITFLNSLATIAFGIDFTTILGYIFSPLALVMGVPTADAVHAGAIMASKLITNEFVALGELQTVAGSLSAKTLAMMSTYAISFSNIGTIGMIIASVKIMNGDQAKVVANNTGRLIIGSVIVSMISATVVGFFF